MTDKKITDLPLLTDVDDTDQIEIVDQSTGTSSRATIAGIADAVDSHASVTASLLKLKVGATNSVFSVKDPQWGPDPVLGTIGAIGDGGSHPLSNYFTTLAAARVVYPHALALTDELDWAASQKALNQANSWSGIYGSGGAYTGSSRGGVVYFPLSQYYINRSWYTDARIRLVGDVGSAFGGKATNVKASTTGDFTAGMGRYPEKFMLKMGVDQTYGSTIWAHAAAVELMEFDCNFAPGLAAMHWWNAGEMFWLDRVAARNSGITQRTVTDVVTTAGSDIVVSATGAFTDDDWRAHVSDPSAGYPSWSAYNPAVSDYTRTDAQFVYDSDILYSPGASFTSAHLHKELSSSGGGPGGHGYAMHVIAIVDSTHVQISSKWRFANSTQTIVFTRPRDLRIREVIDATHARLDRAATANASGATMTIDRPRPGIQLESGGATLHLGKINVTGNSGAGVEFIKGSGGFIQSVSGDNNGGNLIRFNRCGASADPISYTVGYIKAENNQYGVDTFNSRSRWLSYADHDPVIGMDNCGECLVHILGGTASASERGSVHVQLLQTPAQYYLSGAGAIRTFIDGANPYNLEFERAVWEGLTNSGIPVPTFYNNDGLFHAPMEWNLPSPKRGSVLGEPGSAGSESWTHLIPVHLQPNRIVQGASWIAQPNGTGNDSLMFQNIFSFLFSKALNDEIHWYTALSRGTWLFSFVGCAFANGGILTFEYSVDGGKNWLQLNTAGAGTNTLDQYSAGQFITLFSPTAVKIMQGGRVITRVRVTGKNASAGAYGMPVSYAGWVRQS